MNILVSGGAGYIGSHTSVALLEAGHSVIIVDNFSNSKRQVVENIQRIAQKEVILYEVDVIDAVAMDELFSRYDIDGVIHFAALKSVGESVDKPLLYYKNNLLSTIVLAETCLKHHVERFVLSSSATVYGDNQVPFEEKMELMETTTPYGETKAICERMLRDVAKVNSNFAVTILRYFNPVGAHESGLIGEAPNGIPNNLMPFLTQVAKGKLKQLQVFGKDYSTVDGTGVRDYIHVLDLAEGHVTAIECLTKGTNVYNLGTGRGTSVLELVKAFEEANGVSIPYEIVKRRPGDIASCYADVSKAEKELGWVAKRDLVSMCRDSWRFEKNYHER